jgi:hypothetical protein
VDNVPQINQTQTVQSVQPKETAETVNQKLMEIKSNLDSKTSSNNNDVFNSLLAGIASQNNSEPIQEPTELPFNSPESIAYEEQFAKEAEQYEALKQPTPEMVNPNNLIYSNSWTTEVGMKMKTWANEHSITGKDQMSAWLIKYCGLDYDHFNPEWTDKFIAWAKALREKQTY